VLIRYQPEDVVASVRRMKLTKEASTKSEKDIIDSNVQKMGDSLILAMVKE
jgi:hypothetical protein